MLVLAKTKKKVDRFPYAEEFADLRKNISDEDYEKVVEEINKYIDSNDVITAGWIPGNDWTGTVYEPLYHACGKNKVKSGQFFGQIVFKILMERTDAVWAGGRFEIDGKAIKSITYFKTDLDPKTF